MDISKILHILFGIAAGIAILIAVDVLTTPDLPRSTCTNITDHDEIVGQKCTYDSGPVLERIELSPDACYEATKRQRGAKYAAEVCYP